MLHSRDLSRMCLAISRDGYDDELVAKMVSAEAAASIWPHSGILISSFSGTVSTASQAPSSASATDPAAFTRPTAPDPRLSTTSGSIWATYLVAAVTCSALGSCIRTVPPREANINAMRRPRVPAPNTATGRFLMSAKVCVYDTAASLHRAGEPGHPGQCFAQVDEHMRTVGTTRCPRDRNHVDAPAEVPDVRHAGVGVHGQADGFVKPVGEDLRRATGGAPSGDRRAVERVAGRRVAPVGPVQPVALDFEIDRLGQAVPQHLDVGAVGGRLSGRDLQARAEDPALPAVGRALLRPVQVAAGGVDHDADALLQPAVVAGVYHQVGQAGPVDADPADPAALPVAPVQRPGTVGHQLLAGGDRPGWDHIAGARTVERYRVHAAVAGREVKA